MEKRITEVTFKFFQEVGSIKFFFGFQHKFVRGSY